MHPCLHARVRPARGANRRGLAPPFRAPPRPRPPPAHHAVKHRAHTACLYKSGIYVFGGGDGVKALNDVWRLDVQDLNKPYWDLISPNSPPRAHASDEAKPNPRGYHTANMVGNKLIVYGGSDGEECFHHVRPPQTNNSQSLSTCVITSRNSF